MTRVLSAFVCAAMLCACGETTQLSGTTAGLEISPAAIAFGSVYIGDSAVRTVTLANSGDGILTLPEVRLRGEGFEWTTPPDRALPGYASRQTRLRFRPTRTDDVEGAIEIDDPGDASGRRVITLNGRGLQPLDCEDGNPCTHTWFDTATATCVTRMRDGPCDDHNACTSGDTCVAGRCLGSAVFFMSAAMPRVSRRRKNGLNGYYPTSTRWRSGRRHPLTSNALP